MDDRTHQNEKLTQGLSASVTAFSKDGLMVRDQQTIDDWTRNRKQEKRTKLFLSNGEDVRATDAVPEAKKEDEKRKMIEEYNEGAGQRRNPFRTTQRKFRQY